MDLANSIGGVMLDLRNIFSSPSGTKGSLKEYFAESMYKKLRSLLYLLNIDHAIKIDKLFDDEYVKLHPYF
jgi:hypothetical protein